MTHFALVAAGWPGLIGKLLLRASSGPPVEGEGGDSLLLFNSGGVTFRHLGML